MTQTAPIPDVARWRMWFALVGGAVAWTAHLLLAYAISEFGCVAGWDQVRVLGLSLVTWPLVAVTVVTFVVAAWATLDAVRVGRRVASAGGQAEDVREIERFMSRAGAYTSGVFALIILVESVPIFYYLGSC